MKHSCRSEQRELESGSMGTVVKREQRVMRQGDVNLKAKGPCGTNDNDIKDLFFI